MKKTYVFLLVIMMFLLNACGAGAQVTPETPETITSHETTTAALTEDEVYNKVLTKLYKKLDIIIIDDTHLDGFDAQEGMVGVAEIAASRTLDLLDKFSYSVMDINEDGVSELMILAAANGDHMQRILCAYTIFDNDALLLFEGDSKNCYYLLNDGSIFNVNLADSSLESDGIQQINTLSAGIYQLQKDAAELSCEDFYFSDGNSYYHNQTGLNDSSASTAIEGGAAAFKQVVDGYLDQINSIEATLLSAFNV